MIDRWHNHRRLRTALIGLATGAVVAGGLVASALPTSAASPSGAGRPDQVGAGRYLVTFADEPAATYDGSIPGYAATQPARGHKLDPTRPEVVSYRARLADVHDRALARVGATKLYDYSVATNGVAADLTAAQAQALAKTPGVVGIEKDAQQSLQTTESGAYLGLDDTTKGLWTLAGGRANAGTGVIVGVIDSGIWPESPSFAGSTPKRKQAGQIIDAHGVRMEWYGDCVQGVNFSSQSCNDKLIGARYYVKGFGVTNVAKEDYLSPRDGSGHGSHTSSTAAGNIVNDVRIDGYLQGAGTMSGMAPAAKLAMYKVCWEAKPGASAGCFNSDSVAAIDDAVADGVDVINYSVGGTTEASVLDVVEQAYRRAANVGVFVANSAGNSGPGASTLDHPSPWLATVAASTFRNASQKVVLGDGQEFIGASTTPPLTTPTPLITSVAAKLATASAEDAALCFAGTLDPAKAGGKVVQCDRGVNARIDKSFEVKRAGGVAMILTNTSPNSLNGDFHAVPSVHVPDTARAAIVAYAATAGATAKIVPLAAGDPVPATPEVAAFSSRGPSTTTGGDILKPDIAAPGVDVVAAVAPPSNHGRSYDYYSGTSMASPHIAGLAALVRATHKDWSPMAIKSALMTTARDHATTTDVFEQGAGFVNPDSAVDPGLVFDSGPNDWRSYMHSLGVNFAPPFNTLPAIKGYELNQASIGVGAMAGSVTIPRTVTNVSGSAEHYTVTETVAGIDLAGDTAFDVGVGAAASKPLSWTFSRSGAALGQWAKGSVILTGDDGHVVRIPVAIRPVAIAAPAEVTGTGSTGEAAFSVTPGFTGTLTTSAAGLVGVVPQRTTIAGGAFDYLHPAESAAAKKYTVVVPAGTKIARFDVDDVSNTDDLDLYVYGTDGKFLQWSASASGDERVTLLDPAPGTYTAYVNGYDVTGGGVYDWSSWTVGSSNAGNFSVAPPSQSATLADATGLTASWTGLSAGQRYLGWIGYTGPDGVADEITIVSITN